MISRYYYFKVLTIIVGSCVDFSLCSIMNLAYMGIFESYALQTAAYY